MEQELFFSGYCRCLDGHRMVEVIVENDALTEVDCGYYGCPHTASCDIAKKIKEKEDR